MGFFAHEFKHAYQFETGRLSMLRAKDGRILGGTYYDKHDEMEAFNRERLFGEGTYITNINQLPKNYKNISNDERNMDNYKWGMPAIHPMPPLTPQVLQRLATKNNNILRYNGVTYFP